MDLKFYLNYKGIFYGPNQMTSKANTITFANPPFLGHPVLLEQSLWFCFVWLRNFLQKQATNFFNNLSQHEMLALMGKGLRRKVLLEGEMWGTLSCYEYLFGEVFSIAEHLDRRFIHRQCHFLVLDTLKITRVFGKDKVSFLSLCCLTL